MRGGLFCIEYMYVVTCLCAMVSKSVTALGAQDSASGGPSSTIRIEFRIESTTCCPLATHRCQHVDSIDRLNKLTCAALYRPSTPTSPSTSSYYNLRNASRRRNTCPPAGSQQGQGQSTCCRCYHSHHSHHHHNTSFTITIITTFLPSWSIQPP